LQRARTNRSKMGHLSQGVAFAVGVTGGLAVPCSIREYAPTPASSTRPTFGGSFPGRPVSRWALFMIRLYRLRYRLPLVPYTLFVTNLGACRSVRLTIR